MSVLNKPGKAGQVGRIIAISYYFCPYTQSHQRQTTEQVRTGQRHLGDHFRVNTVSPHIRAPILP